MRVIVKLMIIMITLILANIKYEIEKITQIMILLLTYLVMKAMRK